jgi:biopolymer transport protein ExbD
MGMSTSAGGGAKNRATPQMNVTPLVDVVLVLLIIFMVVTPLLTKKFLLHVPKKDDKTENEPPPPPDGPKPVVLTYSKDGTIKINSQAVTREDLGTKIGRVLAPRSDTLVFFDADSDAEYGEAVEVMDIARGGGATIAVLTEAVAQQ